MAKARNRGVTPAMLQCLARLVLHYDNIGGAWPSYQTLSDDLGCTRRTVIELIARLRWLGIIASRHTSQRASNTYTIHWPGNWTPAVGATVADTRSRYKGPRRL